MQNNAYPKLLNLELSRNLVLSYFYQRQEKIFAVVEYVKNIEVWTRLGRLIIKPLFD